MYRQHDEFYTMKKWITRNIALRSSPFLSKTIQLLNLDAVRASKPGRVLDSPWKRTPNISQFRIVVKPLNALFEFFGIKRNQAAELYMEPYKNQDMNRYLEHQIIRLKKT